MLRLCNLVCALTVVTLTASASQAVQPMGKVNITIVEQPEGVPVPCRIEIYDATTGPARSSLAFLWVLFERADEDNDWRVTLPDIRKYGPRFSEDRFKGLDKDGDGILMADEMPEPPFLLELYAPNDLPVWHGRMAFSGQAKLTIPAGTYKYVVDRGPEYTKAEGRFRVEPGKMTTVTDEIMRLADLAEEGWWSGDLHVHRPLEELDLATAAADLHIAPNISWWNKRSYWVDHPLPKHTLWDFGEHRHSNILAGEDERNGGALIFMNVKEPFDITAASRDFPSALAYAEQLRAQQPGVWIDLEKPFWWHTPIALANGYGDSIEIVHNHMHVTGGLFTEAWGRERDKTTYPDPWGNGLYTQGLYYHILNSGIRIPPSAGSASGVMMNPVGYDRVYVHVKGRFTYEKWWANLRQGHCFVTNGPLLRCRANGKLPGHVFKQRRRKPINIKLDLKLDGRDAMPFIEIVKNGQVVKTVAYDNWQRDGLGSITFSESGWFLVRVQADNSNTFRFGCTAPFYVEIGSEKRRISKSSAEFFLDWTTDYRDTVQSRLTDEREKQDVLKYHEKAVAFWKDRVNRANTE